MKLLSILISAFILCVSVFWLNTNDAEAVSTNVVIYQLQTGSIDSASQEIVLLHNASSSAVEVTDWCLFYSSSTNATVRTLACIDAPLHVEIWLDPGGTVSFASGEFVIANPGFVPDATFTSGIASTGGHIWITNENNLVIDRVGWGTASLPETSAAAVHISGKVLSRNINNPIIDTDNNFADFTSQTLISPIDSGLYEEQIIVDICLNITDLQTNVPNGYLQDEAGDCFEDICPNLDELQKTVPLGYEKIAIVCSLIPLENSVLLITELLPNAVSSDTGKEFIELYNPNSHEVSLEGYILQIGPGFSKQFTIATGVIGAGQYITFYDSQSNMVLPNTNGVQLRLVAPSGDIVSETPIYTSAPDGSAWVLIDNQWIFTNRPTPAGANQPYLAPAEDEEVNVTTILAPCPAGKYRNPDTNRCRTIETAVSSLAPCDEDEYRSPDTNRCRKVAAAAVLAACSEGQERNPETNRCRKIITLADTETALATVEDVEVESTAGTINWMVISITLIATFGYMIYEWRNEIRQKWLAFRY